MMTQQSAQGFAHWLASVHPDIFVSIAKRALPQLHGLGDISDVLSSIGSSFGSAVSAVGDWVSNPQNVNALSSVATAYFKSQTPAMGYSPAQGAVFNTQLQRAQYGQSPAPISYAQNASGQYIPVYNGQSLTPGMLQSLQPTFLQKYGLWLALGGGALLLVFVLRS